MSTYLIKDEKYFYGAVPIEIEVSEEKRKEILNDFPVPVIPEGEEGVFSLADRVGSLENTLMMVSSHTIKPTQKGGSYLELTFGQIKAKMWDKKDSVKTTLEMLEKNTVFYVDGDIQEYPVGSGNKSVIINRMIPYTGEVEAFKLIQSTVRPLEDMAVELYVYLDELAEPHRSIALKGLKKYWTEFVVKPAAMGHHHAYLGGLLKHTLGLVRLAVYITKREVDPYQAMLKLITVAEKCHKRDLYESLNAEKPTDSRKLTWFDSMDHLYKVFYEFSKLKEQTITPDILIASIIYHDLGKTFEYSHAGESDKFKLLFPTLNTETLKTRMDTGIAMDSLGVLVGHMPYGVMILKDIVESEEIDINIEDFHFYLHNILAHHGKLDWGSPVRPQTQDAYLLHFVDYLDSRWEKSDPIK